MRPNWTNALINAATVALAALAITLGGFRVYQMVFDEQAVADAPVRVSEWQLAGDAAISLGPEAAPVTLVMFSDFLCIHCRAAAPEVKRIRSEFDGDIRFVYRNLPLQAASFPASVAAVCAHEQGAFDAVHDYLFENPNAARSLPWDTLPAGFLVPAPADFLTCLRSERASETVARDTLEAMRIGVSGTPSFLVDSLLYSGNIGYELLRTSVEESLGQRSISAKVRRRFSSAPRVDR